jgi:hypothetical protein
LNIVVDESKKSFEGKTDKFWGPGVETQSPYLLHQQHINMADGMN